MTPDERKLLADIQSAAMKILEKTRGKSVADYVADEDLQLVVERLFTIVGEAATRLRRLSPSLHAAMASLHGPISFRNFLIHVYDGIDHVKVWKIVEEDTPILVAEVAAALEADTTSESPSRPPPPPLP